MTPMLARRPLMTLSLRPRRQPPVTQEHEACGDCEQHQAKCGGEGEEIGHQQGSRDDLKHGAGEQRGAGQRHATCRHHRGQCWLFEEMT